MINFETGNVELNERSMVALQEVLSKHKSAEVKVDAERFVVEKFDQVFKDLPQIIYFTSRDRENNERLEGYRPLHIRDLVTGLLPTRIKRCCRCLIRASLRSVDNLTDL